MTRIRWIYTEEMQMSQTIDVMTALCRIKLQNDKVSDTTEDDSSNTDGNKNYCGLKLSGKSIGPLVSFK